MICLSNNFNKNINMEKYIIILRKCFPFIRINFTVNSKISDIIINNNINRNIFYDKMDNQWIITNICNTIHFSGFLKYFIFGLIYHNIY